MSEAVVSFEVYYVAIKKSAGSFINLSKEFSVGRAFWVYDWQEMLEHGKVKQGVIEIVGIAGLAPSDDLLREIDTAGV